MTDEKESQNEGIPPLRRRTYLVNKKLQFGLMAYMIALGAFSSMLTTLSGLLLSTYSEGSQISLLLTLTVILFGFFFAWGAAALVLSNKLFGPIYRLHKEIKNWNEGNEVNIIKLRKGDHLVDLIDDFNQVVEKHSKRG